MPNNIRWITIGIFLAISLATILYWIWLNVVSIKNPTAIARITADDMIRKATCKERVTFAKRIKFLQKEYLVPYTGILTGYISYSGKVWEFKHKAFKRGKLCILFEDLLNELTIQGYELVKTAN